MRSRSLALALGVAFAMTPGRARADEPTRAQLQAARELFLEATKDEEAARWAAALEKLHRIEEVKVTAGIRYHIALCEERLGQTSRALVHYNEALQSAHDEKNKEVMDLLKERFLTELRERVPTLTIDVPAEVSAAAEVTLDGQAVDRAQWSAPQALDPGVHRVEARAPGRRAFAAIVALNERDRAQVAVTLPLIPVQIVAPAPTPARAGERAREREPEVSAKPSAAAPSRDRTGAVLATTGALALLGGGIAAYAVAGTKASDAESECRAAPQCDPPHGTIRALDGVALGAWVGAAAVGTLAVILWVSPGHHEAQVAAGPGSLRLQGTF